MANETRNALDGYLSLLSGLLKTGKRRRGLIEAELRDHMQQRVAELLSQGVDADEAARRAVAEFGDAAALAEGFSRISHQMRKDLIMRVSIIAATVAIVVFQMLSWLGTSAPDRHHGSPVLAADDEPISPVRVEAVTNDRDQAARQQLDQTIDVDFIAAPLCEVLSYITEASGGKVQYYIRHRSDEFASTPITLTLRNVPAEMVLRLALEQLDLGYYLDNGVIIVTDMDFAASHLDIRVYDVTTILRSMTGTSLSRRYVPSQPSGYEEDDYGADYGGGEYDSGGGYGTANTADGGFASADSFARGRPSRSVGAIENLVRTVQPMSWNESGGNGYVILYQNALVVRQTEEIHRQLELFLRAVEAVVARNEPAVTPGPSRRTAPAADDPFGAAQPQRNDPFGGGGGYGNAAYGVGGYDGETTAAAQDETSHDPFANSAPNEPAKAGDADPFGG